MIVDVEGQKGLNEEKEGMEMEWHVIVALVLAIPVILVPVAFVWYLNIGGIRAARKEAHEKRVACATERVA